MGNTAAPKLGNDFTTGSIPRLVITFMAPFLLANLLTDLYNLVDMIIIGQLVGSVGMVAVTVGGKLLTICTGLSIGLSAGGQVLISQQVGAHRPKEEINAAIGTLFSFLGVFSVVLGVGCALAAEPILAVINTPGAAYADALSYFRITCAGMPLLFGYNAVSSVLRGMGDSKRPLLFIAIASVGNLALDLVFVAVLGLGAPGTALATVLAQGAAFLFALVYLYRRRERFDFDFKVSSLRIDPEKFGIIIKIGVPIALQSLLIHATQLVVIRQVNALGVTEAAVWGILEKTIVMSTLVTTSIKSAGASIAAQNIGAARYDRVVQTLHVSLAITLSAAVVMGGLSMLFPRVVFGLFSHEEAVLAYAPASMAVCAASYLLSAVMGCYDIITTGTGNARLAFLAGVLDGVVFRLLFSFLFGGLLGGGVLGYYFGSSLARVGPILVHTGYYYSGAWRQVRRLVE